MLIQLLVIILVFVLGKLFSSSIDEETIEYENGRKKLCVLSAILLILQSGLRNVAVGPDTYEYYRCFYNDSQLDWRYLIANFKEVYINGEGKDAGYLVFEKLCSYISLDYTVFLLIVACVFFIPMMIVVYRNTSKIEHIVVAVIVYEALFYSFFSITGCRQTIEAGLCFLAFEEIKKRNIWKFVLFIAVGTFIHKSCLIFLPFYWIANLKKTYLLFLLSVIAFPIMYFFGRTFTLQLAILSGSENYLGYAEQEASGAVSFIIFYLIIVFYAFYSYRENRELFDERSAVVNAISLGLFFLPLTFVSAALMRIVQYYSIYLIVFFGYLKSEEDNGVPVYPFAIILLLYKIVSTHAVYGFFWQEMALGTNYM